MNSDTEEAELYYYEDAGRLSLKCEEVPPRTEDILTLFYTSKKLGNPEVVISNT